MSRALLLVLVFLGASAYGCGESKKSKPDNSVGGALGVEPVLLDEQPQSDPDSSVGETPGDEFVGLKETDSERILADPGGPSSSADFGALSASEQGLSLDASIAEAQYAVGKDHLEAHEFKDAIAVLQKAVKSNPKHGRAFLAMGQAHGGLGDAVSARGAFEKAIEAPGDSDEEWVAEAYRLLGYAIREANGSRIAQWIVETSASREVEALLIPLRAR